MIPESQHDDSMASEEFRARSIANLACTVVMFSAVQFDSQLCAGTIEVWDVVSERMLAAKLYSLRNFDSANIAKECIRAQSPSFAEIERDPQRFILNYQRIFRNAIPDASHLNPLPAGGARWTPAIRS